jgi:hypothetical protein
MPDPLAYLPYAIAAAGGTVHGWPCHQLVAAGFTLLQRAAPLVRALAGRRGAILLPNGPAYLTALAACDGRGALLLDPSRPVADLPDQLARANVGALFTLASLAHAAPRAMPLVLLDDIPRRARVTVGERTLEVDLGTHHGLELAGSTDTPGSDEEAVLTVDGDALQVITHRQLLDRARETAARLQFTPMHVVGASAPWCTLESLSDGCVAPLLVGAALS